MAGKNIILRLGKENKLDDVMIDTTIGLDQSILCANGVVIKSTHLGITVWHDLEEKQQKIYS